MSEGENQVQAERSIKQVLHQLHHLRKVWEEVLPINIYYKAIGKLLIHKIWGQFTTTCVNIRQDHNPRTQRSVCYWVNYKVTIHWGKFSFILGNGQV